MQSRVQIYFWLALLFVFAVDLIAANAGVMTDQAGRTVRVPDDPKRIVALAPSITEIVFALGHEHRLAGATAYSNYPDAAKKLPRVGSYVRLDLERIVALNPDLCLATKDGNPRAVVERLDALHIPVFAVNPVTLNTTIESIYDIGAILKTTAKAEEIVGEMRRRIERVSSLVARAEHIPRVFFQIGRMPVVSVGSDTFIHELIVLSGGKNVAEGKVLYPKFSREQIIRLAPEVIIINSMSGQKDYAGFKKEWLKWPLLPAVQNNRIYFVDGDVFNRPSPRLVDALEELVKLIHPELMYNSQ
jgi:iron complex transport system substrate-binding protein